MRLSISGRRENPRDRPGIQRRKLWDTVQNIERRSNEQLEITFTHKLVIEAVWPSRYLTGISVKNHCLAKGIAYFIANS
jgi:hypothetical protein